MNKELLYQMLDIESPADFEYFENLADLLECEEEIEYNELYALLRDIDRDTLQQLIHNYFEEITDFVPGDAAELFILMDKIKLSLMGMVKNSDDESVLANLTDEVERFRCWYSIDSRVICTAIADGEEQEVTVRDALGLARLENLEGDKYTYDFSECTAYELDEYVMSFGDIISASEDEGDSEAYVPDDYTGDSETTLQ